MVQATPGHRMQLIEVAALPPKKTKTAYESKPLSADAIHKAKMKEMLLNRPDPSVTSPPASPPSASSPTSPPPSPPVSSTYPPSASPSSPSESSPSSPPPVDIFQPPILDVSMPPFCVFMPF